MTACGFFSAALTIGPCLSKAAASADYYKIIASQRRRARGVFSRVFLGQVWASVVCAWSAMAQEAVTRNVVVQAEAEELPSAYGAPPDLSHGRISTLTQSYVLSPFSFEFEAGYEGAAFRHRLPNQPFRQEIEMGLPARFTVGIQNQVEHFAGETRDRSFTLEAR